MNKYYTLNRSRVCTATHPTSPNFSGLARSRKLHLTDNQDKYDVPATRCGMRIDSIFTLKRVVHTVFDGRWCRNCFTKSETTQIGKDSALKWQKEHI